MAALRAIARSATQALKIAPSARGFSQRAVAPMVSRTFIQGSARRAFSVSARAFGQGETDIELSSKLQEEIQYEKDAAAQAPAEPEFIQEFASNGIWKIESQAGHDEVVVTRTFGNETIRVLFSIADIDTPQESTEFDEDGQPVASEDEAAETIFPIRCAITITKPNNGALSLDTVAENGTFRIENVSYYGEAKLATELTAEADWKRRGLYIGPQFDHLDVGVQESFEKYLEERDIGAALATFIPEYAEWKEQQEYVKWLEQVHSFIKA